jgi:hypothetical protein
LQEHEWKRQKMLDTCAHPNQLVRS